jgi:sterol desaturase/sphingolipid hydroxylase (fatty acid hydroxylase superfamily)
MSFLELSQECLDAAEGKLPEPVIGPDGKKGKPPLRIQVMKNTFIEKWFAQAHPITPGVWFGPFIVYGLYRGAIDHSWLVLPAFLFGALITTLVEYSLHRFIFHFEPKTKERRVQAFLLHGYHHEFPNDPMRLVLPPMGIWPVAAVFALVWWFVFGAWFWPVYAGTAAGYVAYDWTHYYTHHFNPKSGVGRWIKRYHMLHHHDSPHHRYGITSPLWDHVFGTYLGLKTMARQGGRHAPPAGVAADTNFSADQS